MGRLARAVLALALAVAGCGNLATATPTPNPVVTPKPGETDPRATVATPTPVESIGPPTIDDITPGSVSMWSRRAYLVGGATAANPGPNVVVTGVVAATNDEGATWSVVAVDTSPIVDVSVGPADEAWALGSSVDGTSVAPLFHTTDGGATWSALSSPPALFSHIAFSFDGHGFALALRAGTETVIGVYATEDGGLTWTAIGDPCPAETSLVGLATAGRESAWVGCVGQGATIMEAKAIRLTNDVGRSWSTTGFVNPQNGDHLGNIPSSGHLTGLASGRGGNLWAMQDRGLPLLSFDAGRTWKGIQLGEIDVSAAFAMTRDDHRESLALLWNGDAHAIQLMRSYDDGATWKLVRAFLMPN